MVSSPNSAVRAPGNELASRAAHLAKRWVTESESTPAHPAAERLAGVLRDRLGWTLFPVARKRPGGRRAPAG